MRPEQRPRLRNALYLSATLHFAAFITLIIWGATSEIPEPPRPVDIVMIELPKGPSPEIGLGIEEKPKALPAPDIEPEKSKPEPTPEPEPAEQALVEPTPEPKPKPKPKPQAKPTVAQTPPRRPPSEKDKLLSTIQKIEQGMQQTNGQKASPGWQEGTGTKPLKELPPQAVLMRYRSQVRARIHRQWAAPAAIKALPPAKRPRAVVHVRINESGHIVSKNWVKRSGDGLLDGSVMRAIARSSPLPIPPPEVKTLALSQGFNIDFKP